MHNILSYQTAMRVNSGEIDVRQYVTKRSCVSIVLSVAFFTMVSGFIFGKYDSHRHQQNKIQHQSKDLQLQKELFAIKIKLATSALLAMGNRTADQTTDINEQILTNFRLCLHESDQYAFDIQIDVFLVKLIDREVQLFLECLDLIDTFLRRQNLE